MLAIIDGDVLAYQACKNRSYFHRADNDVTDLVTVLVDEDGRKVQPEYSKEEDARYLRECWSNFKKDLDKLLGKLYCTDYLMAVKGQGCFRTNMYPDYKMNRHGKPSTNPAAEFVPSLRELAVFEGYAVPSDGREADDLLRTWANEARRAGKDYIICSIDKDLRCIPGKHYWMHFQPEKQMMLEISEEQAKRFYYEQLLKGDPTDNIPGVPRIGEVKASKIITACDTEAEMQEAVVEQYVIAYGDVWYDYFISNAKLIHLQNHYHDFFDCRHWPIIKELC